MIFFYLIFYLAKGWDEVESPSPLYFFILIFIFIFILIFRIISRGGKTDNQIES